jgi:hypothetical protein
MKIERSKSLSWKHLGRTSFLLAIVGHIFILKCRCVNTCPWIFVSIYFVLIGFTNCHSSPVS